MEPINLDATQATPVTIKTRAEDGTVSEHHFEVLTLNHPRFVQFQALAKKMRQIQEKDAPTAKEQLEMTAAMAEALDLRVRSTNGPVTITSLWDDGLIGLEHLRLLGERLNEEAVGPPSLSTQRVYAYWVRYGYTPDIVDGWPVGWSSGWLLERTMELEGSPEKWTGQPVGFGLDDPDWDPAFDAPVEAPDVSGLPFYDPEGV